MKIRNPDIEQIEKKIKPLSNREIRWLCFYIQKKGNERNLSQKYPSLSSQEGLINFFSVKDVKALNFYLNEKASHLIPKECFSWLMKNIEAQYFLLSIMEYQDSMRADLSVTQDFFKANNALDEIFNVFDMSYFYDDGGPTENYQYKVDKLKYYEKCYNESVWKLKLKQWVEKEKSNKEFKSWLYTKVQKKFRIRPELHKFYEANHTFEFCIALMCSYKVLPFSKRNKYELERFNIHERNEAIRKIKRDWASKKNQLKNGRKTKYHMPLTKETVKKLETLSNKEGLKPEAIVTCLINVAYETYCLDENGKEKY